MYHKLVNQEREINMPPSRACGICRNRMNEVCLEECAPDGDYEHFDPNMNRPTETFPNLSLEEYRHLTGKMKGEWLFIQQTKILEAINGEPRHTYYPRSRRIPKNFRRQDVPAGSERENSLREDREERQDQEARPVEVDRS